MKQYKKILITLALLLTAATGAWADERKPQAEDKLKWENVHLNKF